MSTNPPLPKRSEIWLVNLDPTVGSEIKKTRPVVIVNSDALGRLPLRLIAPITEWKDHFKGSIWHLRIDPDSRNGLSKTSSIDILQPRSGYFPVYEEVGELSTVIKNSSPQLRRLSNTNSSNHPSPGWDSEEQQPSSMESDLDVLLSRNLPHYL